MRATTRLLGPLLIPGLLLAAGCGSSDEGALDKKVATKDRFGGKKAKKAPAANGAANDHSVDNAIPKPKPPEPPAPKIYPVELSDEHAKTCLVKQRDKMPDFTLKDPEGKPHTLSSLLTRKLTVVVLWSSESSQSRNALVHLRFDADKDRAGVHYVGINVGEQPEVVKEAIAKAKVKFPVLLDPDKSFFNKVANDLLPRVYLLDEEGRIVWFNVTFQGPDTRKKLNAAIDYLLTAEKKKST